MRRPMDAAHSASCGRSQFCHTAKPWARNQAASLGSMQAATRYGRREKPSTRSSLSLRPWARTRRAGLRTRPVPLEPLFGREPGHPDVDAAARRAAGIALAEGAILPDGADRARWHRRCGARATTSCAGHAGAQREELRFEPARGAGFERIARGDPSLAAPPEEHVGRRFSSRGSRSRAPTAGSPHAGRCRRAPWAGALRTSSRRRRARRDLLEQLLPDDAMHRRRRMTLVVEEVRRRIADRRRVLIEDRPPGARARRVDDAVRRRMLHDRRRTPAPSGSATDRGRSRRPPAGRTAS